MNTINELMYNYYILLIDDNANDISIIVAHTPPKPIWPTWLHNLWPKLDYNTTHDVINISNKYTHFIALKLYKLIYPNA